MTLARRSAAVLIAAVAIAAPPAGGEARAASRLPVPDFLARAGFTADQLAALGRGGAVARVLEKEMVGPNEMAEIAVVGAIRVDVSRETFVDGVKEMKGFQDGSQPDLNLIHNPPRPSDFATLKLPRDDIADLEDCRSGDCALKLGGDTLEEFRSRIDWDAPDRDEQVNRYTREQLLEVATDYLKEGTVALERLEDKETRINLDRQFHQLLEETPDLISFYEDLANYLRDFPEATLDSSVEVHFWALTDFGLKPTMTLNHAVGYFPPETEDAVIAWRMVYASHYFNAGLTVTTYARDGDAMYLVQLVRVRADSLGGMFGGVKRGKMASAVQENLVKLLEASRDELEGATR